MTFLKFLTFCVAILISLALGLLTLSIEYKVLIIIGSLFFLLFFIQRTDFAFCFILSTRSLFDLFSQAEVGQSVRINQYLGVLLSFLLFFYLIFVRHNFFSTRPMRIYAFFILVSFVPLFMMNDLLVGSAFWMKILQAYFVFNFTVWLVVRSSDHCQKTINMILIGLLIGIILPYILFVKNFIFGTDIIKGGYERYSALGEGANTFSYYLLSVFPICLLYSSLSDHIWQKKIIWRAILIGILLTAYMTFTRNVWIGFAVILITRNVVRKQYKFILYVLCGIVILTSLSHTVQDRFKDIIVLFNADSFFDLPPNLMSMRIGIWQANMKYFLYYCPFVHQMIGKMAMIS